MNVVFIQRLILMGLPLLVLPGLALAFDWQSLWKTENQQANALYKDAEYQSLIEKTDNSDWKAHGYFKEGDYAKASELWLDQATKNTSQAVDKSKLYNAANALVHQEHYQQAIDLYNTVLSADPTFSDASANKAIAEQLLALSEQASQQQQGGDGENEEQQSDEQQSDDQQSEDQSGQQQNGDQNQENSSESQSANNEDNSNSADQNNSDQSNAGAEQQSGSEQQQALQDEQDAEQERLDAEQALAAEAQLEQKTTEELNANAAVQPSEPLSEREQANEQWLRQIPDDPAGLLQRKLLQRHESEYPEVGNSAQPW